MTSSRSTSPRSTRREAEIHAFNTVLADEARAAADADRRGRRGRPRSRAARRRAGGAQGQHVHAGHPDDLLVADPRGLAPAVRRHRRRAAAGGRRDPRSARPTSTSSRWDRARRTRRSARPATPTTRPACRAGRAAAAPPRSPPASPPSASAATPAGRSASRPRCAASSASSRPTAWSAATGSSRSPAASTRSARSPTPSLTPRSSSEVIGGHDPNDSTSIPLPAPSLTADARRRCRGPARRADHRPARGRRPRRAGAGRGRLRRARRRRRQDRRRRGAGVHVRAHGVLPDRAGRGVEQPRPLRRRALRPAGRRARHQRDVHGDPRGRVRRRGEAADHARHVRPVGRLLRRLLRQGAQGPPADRRRLRPGLRARRRAAHADLADGRLPVRREDREPAGDVPLRHVHDPVEPVRPPGDERSLRDAAAPVGCLLRVGVPGVPRRQRSSEDRRMFRRRPRALGGRRRWRSHARTDSTTPTTTAPIDYELVVGLEVHVELATAVEAVLRQPQPVRRRAEHQHRPGDARPARAPCRCSTAAPSSWRCASGWRSTAASSRASSTARTTSIRTCPRRTRSASTTCRSTSTAGSTCPTAPGSASSGPTSRRTPASRPTSAAPAAASTAATSR